MRTAAAASRNAVHITQTLLPYLDRLAATAPAGHPLLGLEIASGTGQHLEMIAPAHGSFTWQPSELDGGALLHIDERLAPFHNCLPACQLDVRNSAEATALLDRISSPDSRVPPVSVGMVVNLFHIAEPAVVEDFFALMAAVCHQAGGLAVYGPFKVEGQFTSDGNYAFDQQLRGQDPTWGIRDVEAVMETASAFGFSLVSRHHMPANNFLLWFEHCDTVR